MTVPGIFFFSVGAQNKWNADPCLCDNTLLTLSISDSSDKMATSRGK